MTLEISALCKRFAAGAESALTGIDLSVADGEFLALLGPSGAGKTTLLRIIAGLDQPDSGTVAIAGCDVRRLSPRQRQIGFVFQNYALFRHMTVARNIAFGLTVKPRRERPTRAEITARVEELLDLMQLADLGGRFPSQLSGGQRQRAALARALAIDPRVLLLDEPFGALDAKVRAELREWLRGLQRKLRLTTIFVTHDQHEALQLADRVAILRAGRIEQVGSPAQIYDRPASPFVTEFLGGANRIEVEIRAGRALTGGTVLPVPCRALDDHPEGRAVLFVRPHDIAIADQGAGVRARIRDTIVVGPRRVFDLDLNGLSLRAESSRDTGGPEPRPGADLPIEFAKVILFRPDDFPNHAGPSPINQQPPPNPATVRVRVGAVQFDRKPL